MSHEFFHNDRKGLILGLKIAKLALQAASVAAGFCIVREIHRVHKSLEAHAG